LIKGYTWDFLLCGLACFGFPEQYIGWIRECFSTRRFSIALNGTLVGYFESQKGLRQWDPISPYLYVLVMEVLARLIEEAAESGNEFQYHPRCAGVKLNHLCFADDALLFSKVSLQSIEKVNLASFTRLFWSVWGLRANPMKNTLFCDRVSSRIQEQLLNCLNLKEGKFPVRYWAFH
jgi:hypothetical protein